MSVPFPTNSNTGESLVTVPNYANLNPQHAVQEYATLPSSANIFVMSTVTVEPDDYQYTALAEQVVAQHNFGHAATTGDTISPTQDFEANSPFPYQRYSGYNPMVPYVNNAEHQYMVGLQQVDSTQGTAIAYINTPSYTVTPSYNNDTSTLVRGEDTSSIQLEPESERYNYAQTQTQYTQAVDYELEYDTAFVGAQFNVDANGEITET